MRTTRFKRVLAVGLVVGAAMALLLTAAPAGAAPPGIVIVAAGSDTTENVMDKIMGGAAVNEFNVKALQKNPLTVPGDTDCDTLVYDVDTVPASPWNGTTGTRYVTSGPLDTNGLPTFPFPFGSSNGRAALRDAVSPGAATWPPTSTGGSETKKGCIDIARSSAQPSSSADGTLGNKSYFGFALDAVMWSSPSFNAPNELTLAELRGIYRCQFTDWAQVGGAPGPIQRFVAQLGSGTSNFFRDNVLAMTAAEHSFSGTPPTNGLLQAQAAPPGSQYPCPQAKTIEENNGNDLLLENDTDGFGPITSNASQYANSILPYSSGKFVAQSVNRTNPTKDIRGGVRPGGLSLTSPSVVTTPIYGVRWTGSNFFLNNATVNGTSATVQTITNAKTDGTSVPIAPDGTLESSGAGFDSTDIGKTLDGSCVAPGTVVTGIVSANEVNIAPASLVTAASNCTVRMGAAAISELNPNLTSASDGTVFPGARMLFNVLNSLSPATSFNAARDIVGYVDTPAGTGSPLCSDDGSGAGTKASDIESEGFLPLPPVTSAGGRPGTTCRLTFVPAS